jgi:hypothetical protein
VLKYDFAVAGAGLGGLAAAALLSSQKRKTIVIESAESLNSALGVFEKNGFTFLAAPSLSYGFQRGEAISELSAFLGVLQDVSVLSPCYQVALPDHRITVYPEQNETLEELRREFPKEIDALSRFYRDVHKQAVQNGKNRFSSYVSDRRAAAGFVAKYRFSRQLASFFDVQSRYFHQKPLQELSLSSLIALCDTPPLYIRGGFKKFCNALYGIILQHGGEVRYQEHSPELVFKNGALAGIKTSRGLTEAGCILLDDIQQNQKTLYIGLHDRALPVGMAHLVLLLPDYASPEDFISLSVGADDAAALTPPGVKALTATLHSPRARNAEKKALTERISSLMPFLDEHTVFMEEQKREKIGWKMHGDMAFRALRSNGGESALFRSSRRRDVYLLRENPDAPLQTISAAALFVKKMN